MDSFKYYAWTSTPASGRPMVETLPKGAQGTTCKNWVRRTGHLPGRSVYEIINSLAYLSGTRSETAWSNVSRGDDGPGRL